MKILVSACLLGYNYKYNGKNNYNKELVEFLKKQEIDVIPICPEYFGGLSIPRNPSERICDKVMMNNNRDVTEMFNIGAQKALKLAIENNCKLAIMKAKSPSCGFGEIYDGTFSGVLIKGNGVTSDLFIENNIVICNEMNYEKFVLEYKKIYESEK